jgi:hypothetical protein
LVDFLKKCSPLKPLGQMNQNFAVSEEKILEIDQSETRNACGGHAY